MKAKVDPLIVLAQFLNSACDKYADPNGEVWRAWLALRKELGR